MITIIRKEIASFFSSAIGLMVISVFIVVMGLFLWVFQDFSILDYGYAGLDQLFEMAPVIYLFLIPALTMRAFSEETQSGTLELISTKPITEWQLVLGKFFAAFILVIVALLPTLLYLYTVYDLSSPRGNIDFGAITGSYIGLLLLGAAFTAIGLWSSTLSKNQIVCFIVATFLCFVFYWGFLYLSKLPVFFGSMDLIVEKFGIDYHYRSLSRGLMDTRDVIYFLSLIGFLLYLCVTSVKKIKTS